MNSEQLRQIYASAPVSATPFEVVSIEAPWFTQPYYLQNVFTEDIQVTLENGDIVDVLYAPMSLGESSTNADLNYERTIIIQFVNDILATEQERYNPDLHDPEQQLIKSRGYIYYRTGEISSLQTNVRVARVRDIVRDAETGASSIKISSKPANETATGEIATMRRVPMLKGFI